jgi:transcription elongation factor GreA
MVPISKNGYEKLKEKIEQIKIEFEKMPAIIASAREKGDLKENAEYHAARERQGMLQAELNKLNGDLSQAQVIDPENLPADTVTFGKTVYVTNVGSGEEESYTLVGPAEAHPESNKISIISAIAQAFLGKKTGMEIVAEIPAGTKTYKINKIAYEEF